MTDKPIDHDEDEIIILDGPGSDHPDYSKEAVEEYRRRTEAGEDPVEVAEDINRDRYKDREA